MVQQLPGDRNQGQLLKTQTTPLPHLLGRLAKEEHWGPGSPTGGKWLAPSPRVPLMSTASGLQVGLREAHPSVPVHPLEENQGNEWDRCNHQELTSFFQSHPHRLWSSPLFPSLDGIKSLQHISLRGKALLGCEQAWTPIIYLKSCER